MKLSDRLCDPPRTVSMARRETGHFRLPRARESNWYINDDIKTLKMAQGDDYASQVALDELRTKDIVEASETGAWFSAHAFERQCEFQP